MNKHVAVTRRLNIWERTILYGITGFAAEVCFTASWEAVEHGNRKMIGVSSMYIFFVYGFSILLLERIFLATRNILPIFIRGIIYVVVTFCWEFTSGMILKRWDACPWDYSSYFHYHFMGLITFEYIPVWYVASILCELTVIHFALNTAWTVHTEEEDKQE